MVRVRRSVGSVTDWYEECAGVMLSVATGTVHSRGPPARKASFIKLSSCTESWSSLETLLVLLRPLER